MQSNNDNQLQWLLQRGITNDVLSLFEVTTQHPHPLYGSVIRIPYSEQHAKYRRDPNDPRKPKYVYDTGGKVTLYGYNHLVTHPTSRTNPVVITEGELDTLVLWSHNIPAVSSTGGAMSWQTDWSPLLTDYNVYLCFDNDETGARGMVKALKSLPNASVIILPAMPDGKDISDYIERGGDFRKLMDSALRNITPESVAEDMGRRQGMMLPTTFHQAYLDEYHQALHRTTYTPSTYTGDDRILRAKSYPMTNLIDFKRNKACCPWHNERTPSLQYYPKTNSAYCFGSCGRAYDSIDAYRQKHGTDFINTVKALNDLV